jgi:membrane-bound ClpP family serine protease
MTIFFIVILILFGITLIVLEVLLLPGLIAGILGAIFLLMGIAWTWQIYGSAPAFYTAIAAGVLLGISLVLSLRSGIWGRFSLKDKLEGKMNQIDPEKVKAGDRGAAISSLRPMGTVRVNGERYEAQSESVLIPPNYPVEVVRIDGYKLIVKPIV